MIELSNTSKIKAFFLAIWSNASHVPRYQKRQWRWLWRGILLWVTWWWKDRDKQELFKEKYDEEQYAIDRALET